MRRRIHIEHQDDHRKRQAEEDKEAEEPAAVAPETETPEEVQPAEEPAVKAGEDEIAGLRARVEELEQQLEQEKKQKEEARNQYLRALADFQNFRRRAEETGKQDRQFANQGFITGLLPILDNFERALDAAEKSRSFEALMGGVALILRQLQDYLKKNGVEPIEAVGQEFDPNFHEAVMRVEDGEHPENTVVDELQRGYTMHSRVLRPAMVKVAKSE
jgi:molecular chaperone GrpE